MATPGRRQRAVTAVYNKREGSAGNDPARQLRVIHRSVLVRPVKRKVFLKSIRSQRSPSGRFHSPRPVWAATTDTSQKRTSGRPPTPNRPQFGWARPRIALPKGAWHPHTRCPPWRAAWPGHHVGRWPVQSRHARRYRCRSVQTTRRRHWRRRRRGRRRRSYPRSACHAAPPRDGRRAQTDPYIVTFAPS